MPDKKMDKKQLNDFKKDLLSNKEKIIQDIKKMTAVNSPESRNSTDEVSGHVHMADVATDMYDREFNLSLASNDRELLNKIESAIQRINKGDFGLCSECKQSIQLARLKAIPYVETCLKCQEQLEKKIRKGP